MNLPETEISVDIEKIDILTEKANRLVQLLREVVTIINSLSSKEIEIKPGAIIRP